MLSIATAALARAVGRPYMLCAAGEFAALDKPRPVARMFHLVFGLSMIRGAAKLIAITELEKTDIVRHCGVSVDQVAVLPNGVEAVQSVTKSCSLGGEENYILFVGRLAEIKGPDLLLEAFASICDRFPKVSLVLAGPDFGLEKALRARASDFGLTNRVHFKGFLSPTERSDAYRKALFLVVPSRAEAMSLVALEAGAFQKPVIVTDQCGLDAVATSCGGRVCAATSSAIAEAITEMLTDPNISQLGANWHRHVIDNYAWPKIAREFVNIAEDVR
jgi:glycosyltransferase involved in cell wall biosynthesis